MAQRALHLRHADAAHASSRRGCRSSSAPRTTILYSSCFDANGGVFETLLGAEDAVISDELNHASIIDGIRLCKAQPAALPQPRHGRPARRSSRRPRRTRADASSSPTACSRWTATSPRWTRSATWPSSYDALVHGRRLARRRLRRRRRPRHARAVRRAWTASTSSPARSARRSAAPPAATSARTQEIVDLLRQRSRPYLFSNAVAPAVVAGSLAALELAAGVRRQRAPAARQHDAVPAADDRGGLRPAARRRTRSSR